MNKFFDVLQRVGKAFMLPIALLPAAGLLLGIGASFTNSTTIETYNLETLLGQGTILNYVLTIMKNVGEIIFQNLPAIFAIGIGIGLAKQDKGTGGLAGFIGFLVMHKTISSTLAIKGIYEESVSVEALEESGLTFEAALASSQSYTTVLGMFTLQMSVLGGIIAGFIAAYLHNRFLKVKLPQFLGFFSGSRFIPIITSFFMIFVGIALTFIWPSVQAGISSLGILVEHTGYLGSFMYGAIKRSLIPFGLHHVFYMPFWQTAVGGTMEIAGREVFGAQNIFFAQLADPATTSFEVLRGTRFFSGEFVFMIFGLPGAALAMYHTAKLKKRVEIAPLLFSAALTSILTGITEPIEFTFLFVAPFLYYFVHVPLTGLAHLLMHYFNVGVGLTFSGGFIDMFLFGILQGNSRTHWIYIPIVGFFYFFIYYFLFKTLILRFNIETPGRERDDFSETNGISKASSSFEELALKLVEALGGKENISYLDSCITRVRIQVKDESLIKSSEDFKKLGAKGVVSKGKAIQLIYGTDSEKICFLMQEIK